MLEIGKYNELRIQGNNDLGYLLSDGRDEVLLTYHHAPKNLVIGDNLFVFVYLDKEGRVQGTTQKPLACVGDFAFLNVVDETDDGVFMDLGIDKDLYVPTKEQKRPMEKGMSYVVYVFLDDHNQRLIGSSRLSDFIEEDAIELEEGDEVSMLISERTDLGYNAIVNNKYTGLMYHNELFSALKPGELKKGWVKKIRVGGKIDLTLQPIGYGHILDTKESLLMELKASGGTIALGDKSDPQDIYQRFQISKSAFKKTIGALYKDRMLKKQMENKKLCSKGYLLLNKDHSLDL